MVTVASKRIGFIGLGAMGLPMAQNLIKNGFELHITANRNRIPVDLLAGAGATEHSSVGEVVSHCDVLITILPTDREMESVLLSDEVLSSVKPGMILIEMTSGSPAMMKKVGAVYSAKGAQVLDGPVSGGTIGAEQGTLTVMAGGETRVLEQVLPILEAMAKNIYPVGAIGAGKAIKAINQMLAGIHMVASAEAAALAEKLGVDSSVLKQVIGSSSGASWMFMNKLDSLTNRNFNPGFKLSLMKKDVQIAVNEAADLELPLAQAALEMYKSAERDSGDLDFSAIGKSILS
ncbi:NAD(P)-dependent oxidoreductase [Paenibacillus alkaliterrae]|uniref:NAD(P)-dependent oxidoreductase n=1 Tax=Paenibacillus alkaliterrae TaxID=320909 RepID=UPI001F1866E5|nr:NAD(P)-dependent oxidoreductase [Paenibacillus alkaliterrae]MCF2937149.1 NAD(P)-dependent oxidoreductase [Paenibacillus alkaliterrae]